MPRLSTFIRLLAILFLFSSTSTYSLFAQDQPCADEIILNSYQPSVKAYSIRIKNGFSVAGGSSQSFVGESCGKLVQPPAQEACNLTMSANMQARTHQTFPLTASFDCTLAGKAYAFDGVNDYVQIAMPAMEVVSSFTWEAWVKQPLPTRLMHKPARVQRARKGSGIWFIRPWERPGERDMQEWVFRLAPTA
jgi:hypothetical protein